MKWKRWLTWFGVFIGVTALGAGVSLAYIYGRSVDPLRVESGRTLIGLLCAFQAVWSVHALVQISRGEVGRFSRFVQVSITTYLLLGSLSGVYLSIVGTAFKESTFPFLLTSFWALSWVYILSIELLRVLLSRGGGLLGVAKTVLVEAIRMKISIAFLVLLAVLVAGLPFVMGQRADMDTADPLRFRIQSYLQYSMTAASLMLGLMTVILAAATLSFEIEKKQIHTVLTKPIGRGTHLLGKWLGLVLLNGVLVTLTGLTIYGFTVHYLGRMPTDDFYDESALFHEVLTSRATVYAYPPVPFDQVTRERVDRIQKEEPERVIETGRDIAMTENIVDPPLELLVELGRRKLSYDIAASVEMEWRVLPPGESRHFVFEGLKEAKDNPKAFGVLDGKRVPLFQLRYKCDSTGDLEQLGYQLPVELYLNGQLWFLPRPDGSKFFPPLGIQTVQTIYFPTHFIDDNGRLALEIKNVNPYDRFGQRQETLTFSTREPMQVLFICGTFEGNFFRAMLVLFVKLAWIAMLGLAFATFLSFPVAMVGSALILSAAMAAPYLMESYGMFGNAPVNLVGIVAAVLKGIGLFVTKSLQSYSVDSPTRLLVDGREFSWAMLGRCALWVGVVWTAITGGVGWLIYRRRELARVQV